MRTVKLLAVAATLALGAFGCADMAGTVDEIGQVDGAAQTANSLKLNGLLANGLKLNGLKLNGLKLNGLKLNGLKLNGLKLNGLKLNGAETYDSEKAAQYIVECGQASGTSISVCDDADSSYCKTFYGALTVGPTDPASASDQEKVSSCVIARLNAAGVSHTIDLAGNGLTASGGSYQWEEGKYWGNLYSESGATLNGCYVHGSNIGDSTKYVYTGRTCWIPGANGNPFSGQQIAAGENDCGIMNPGTCTTASPPANAESVFVTERYCNPFGCY